MGNAFGGSVICGYAIIQKHAICAGDGILIWSHIYITFLSTDDSLFEFFSFKVITFSPVLPRLFFFYLASYLIAP